MICDHAETQDVESSAPALPSALCLCMVTNHDRKGRCTGKAHRPSDDSASHEHDLHEFGLTQLACHGPCDAGADRAGQVALHEHGCILVEAYCTTIGPHHPPLLARDDSCNDVLLRDPPVGFRRLHHHPYRVTDIGWSTPVEVDAFH